MNNDYKYPPFTLTPSKKIEYCVIFAPMAKRLHGFFAHHGITEYAIMDAPMIKQNNPVLKEPLIVKIKTENRQIKRNDLRLYLAAPFKKEDMEKLISTCLNWRKTDSAVKISEEQAKADEPA